MKKLMVFLMALGLVIGGSGLAQADSWLTTPILGYDSSYTGDVIINSGPTPTNIPHSFLSGDPLFGTGSPSMSTFTVGQSVHTGSGVYLTAGNTYGYSAVFTDLTNPLIFHSYSGSFSFAIGEDPFWMTWNSPTGITSIPGVTPDGGGVQTLTNADIGNWNYVESYTLDGQQVLTSTTPFTVTAVPEPGTLLLLGSGLLGLALTGARKKFRK